MEEYIEAMKEYTPASLGTGKDMNESPVVSFAGTPSVTAVTEEEKKENIPYMAPKTIEVSRYTLKK